MWTCEDKNIRMIDRIKVFFFVDKLANIIENCSRKKKKKK